MNRNEELINAVVEAISQKLEQPASNTSTSEYQISYEWTVGRKWLMITFISDYIHWFWNLDGASADGSIPVSPKAIAERIAQP